ncbi:MAG TPA: hypothetical protein VFJ58_10620 [Armatimonadota bacterium]|nr:hypothetical protein [Armatimonadota bacterium]
MSGLEKTTDGAEVTINVNQLLGANPPGEIEWSFKSRKTPEEVRHRQGMEPAPWTTDVEVDEYLDRNPGLEHVLYQTAEHAAAYFGSGAAIRLRVYRSRESLEEEELVVLIQTTAEPEEALQMLYRLQDEWWFHQPASETGRVSIDVCFA